MCLDVGAHVGSFLDVFLEYALQGRHLAFEPLPELAVRLSERYPGVQVEQCVLGELDGEATFYRQVDRPAWSSLAAGHGLGGPVERLTVRMRRLDDLVDRAAFLKIDVEGAELGVLRGASQLLESGVIVLFEHAHIHAHHFDTTPADVWTSSPGTTARCSASTVAAHFPVTTSSKSARVRARSSTAATRRRTSRRDASRLSGSSFFGAFVRVEVRVVRR